MTRMDLANEIGNSNMDMVDNYIHSLDQKEYKQRTFGKYVLTPCANAYNTKVSFWITKEGYTVAQYVFSIEKNNAAEYDNQIKNIKGYISLFKKKYEESETGNKKYLVALDSYYVSATARTITCNDSINNYSEDVNIYEEFKQDDMDGALILGTYNGENEDKALKEASVDNDISVDLLTAYILN